MFRCLLCESPLCPIKQQQDDREGEMWVTLIRPCNVTHTPSSPDINLRVSFFFLLENEKEIADNQTRMEKSFPTFHFHCHVKVGQVKVEKRRLEKGVK